MEKKRILSIALALVSLCLAVLAYVILPERVIIQFSVGSSGNSTAPKLLAILIPTALGMGGAVVSLLDREDERIFGKSLLVSIVGVALGIIMIAVNSFVK